MHTLYCLQALRQVLSSPRYLQQWIGSSRPHQKQSCLLQECLYKGVKSAST